MSYNRVSWDEHRRLSCRFLATQHKAGFVGLAIASPTYIEMVLNGKVSHSINQD